MHFRIYFEDTVLGRVMSRAKTLEDAINIVSNTFWIENETTDRKTLQAEIWDELEGELVYLFKPEQFVMRYEIEGQNVYSNSIEEAVRMVSNLFSRKTSITSLRIVDTHEPMWHPYHLVYEFKREDFPNAEHKGSN